MVSTEWMKDIRLQHIPKEKLQFLQKLAFESENLAPKEKMPYFFALASRAKEANISFSPSEMELIIGVLKEISTPAEIAKMNQLLKIYKQKGSLS